jgi:hypothetical protein
MSAPRLAFFLSVSALALLWCAVALTVSGTRFQNRNVIEAIRDGKTLSTQMLNDAISSYASTTHMAPCNAGLHTDMALLLGAGADAVDDDAPLAHMQEELATHLSCSPTDGKAWLDFATIDVYREGFTNTALGAYRMSAQVAPGESWLAEKRLFFALQFRALFDAPAMQVARADIAVLKRAHPNRLSEVLKVADIKDTPALEALFATVPNAQ